jgi:hypothetical protein
VTINIKRQGGFAGIEQHLVSVETKDLPQGAAEQLLEHLGKLTDLVAQAPPPTGADQFQYKVGISEAGVTPRTLTVVDTGDAGNPAMKHLSAILDLAGTTFR